MTWVQLSSINIDDLVLKCYCESHDEEDYQLPYLPRRPTVMSAHFGIVQKNQKETANQSDSKCYHIQVDSFHTSDIVKRYNNSQQLCTAHDESIYIEVEAKLINDNKRTKVEETAAEK